MEQTTQDRHERRRRLRERIAALLFVLFPGMIAAGLLAPNVIQVIAAEDHAPETPPVYRSMRLDRPPLELGTDYESGEKPILVDMENLFSSTAYDTSGPSMSRLLSFPRSGGDEIVLDDVDQALQEVLFQDLLMASELPEGGPSFEREPFLPLSGTLPRGNGLREDDFPGDGVGDGLPPGPSDERPVPEPETGLLVAFGLLILAASRRRKSRR